MTRIYIYEQFSPEQRFDSLPDTLSIAATPEAAYGMEKAGVRFECLDAGDEYAAFSKVEEKYFYNQIGWMREVDNLLQKEIPVLGKYQIPLLKSTYVRIKYVLDTQFMFSCLIANLLRQYPQVKQIIVVGKNAGLETAEKYNVFKYESSHRNDFYRILTDFCTLRNVKYEEITPMAPASNPKEAALKTESAARLNAKRFIKSLVHLAKFKQPFRKKKRGAHASAFFMHLGSLDMDSYLEMTIPQFSEVFTYENGVIYQEGFLRKSVHAYSETAMTPHLKAVSEQFHSAAGKIFEQYKIYDMFNEETNRIVQKNFQPYFAQFLKKEAPEMISRSLEYSKIFDQLKFTHFYCRGNSDMESLILIIAAKWMSSPEVYCVQHASSGFKDESMSIYDTNTYDTTLVRDPVSYDCLKNMFSSHHSAKIIESYHYLRTLRNRHRPNRKTSGAKPTVLYVQKKFPKTMQFLNLGAYFWMWYYLYQKALVNFMGKTPQCNWIYKHAKGQTWAEKSIIKYIREKNYSNIEIRDRNFSEALDGVDRIIVDFASGALFESAAMGFPTLCIIPDYFRISPLAERIFGNIFQRGKSIEDFLRHIKTFISSDAEIYRTKSNLF